MKTFKFLMLLALLMGGMVKQSSAMINVYLFAQWEITTTSTKCVNGQGACIVVSQKEDPNAGVLSIEPSTLNGSFTFSSKTEGVTSYVKNGQFILPVDSYINPSVLLSETGIQGQYRIPKGTYKCILEKNGFYRVFITLAK